MTAIFFILIGGPLWSFLRKVAHLSEHWIHEIHEANQGCVSGSFAANEVQLLLIYSYPRDAAQSPAFLQTQRRQQSSCSWLRLCPACRRPDARTGSHSTE